MTEWGYFPVEAENDVGGGCVQGGCDYDTNVERIKERKYYVDERAGNNPVFFQEPSRKSACQIDCGCLKKCDKKMPMYGFDITIGSRGWLLLILMLLIGVILLR